ncbi:MAG: alpha/beta hydrolase [Lachnospiraceae bacterium]|jgi:acetyl esterase/lipase
MEIKKYTLNKERNVTLTCYLQAAGKEFRYVMRRPAVLILPGGGYQYCSVREADPVAFPYLKAGYDAMILHYSVADHDKWPNPLDDYEQAMALIRSKADEWKVYRDKIAVIGFSAGGHLAACAASMSENRPNAAILGYAVTTGGTVKECNPSAPDVISHVDSRTCPCFLFATRDDGIVPIQNTIRMIDALEKAGISFESHIYAYGPHGFSTGDSSIQPADSAMCPRVKNWVGDSIEWLRDIFGDFSQDGMTEPKCAARVNGDSDEFLSVDCTLGHLMKNQKAAEQLLPVLKSLAAAAGMDEKGLNMEDMTQGVAGRMKLRDAFDLYNTPQAKISEVDEQLRNIPNA